MNQKEVNLKLCTHWPSNCMEWKSDLFLSISNEVITVTGSGKIPTPIEDAYWYGNYDYKYLLQVKEVTHQDDVHWKAVAYLKAKCNTKAASRLNLEKIPFT